MTTNHEPNHSSSPVPPIAAEIKDLFGDAVYKTPPNMVDVDLEIELFDLVWEITSGPGDHWRENLAEYLSTGILDLPLDEFVRATIDGQPVDLDEDAQGRLIVVPPSRPSASSDSEAGPASGTESPG